MLFMSGYAPLPGLEKEHFIEKGFDFKSLVSIVTKLLQR